MNEIEAIKHFNRVIAQLKYLDGGKDGPHLKYYIRVRNAKNRRRLQASRLAVEALREQAERVLCAKCKHYNKTGCSAGFGWCENMDRGTHDEFYCASGKRLEVEP